MRSGISSLWTSLLLAVAVPATSAAVPNPDPLLLRQPTLSRTQIVFVYGGALWSVARDGGDAVRLTSGTGTESDPHFSPDGKWIAFSADYGGNPDVYVIPTSGGEPRRLTYHPSADIVKGWTPDGRSILFFSTRDGFANRVGHLFTVPLTGGLPDKLPFPLAYEGTYSPDGSQIAYRPVDLPLGVYSHYRGGTESKIWVAKLSDSSYFEIPRGNWNDFVPLWLGDKIYFLSDERGAFTLCAYDTRSRRVQEAVPNSRLPIREASAGPDAIVYSQFGSIHIFDPISGREHEVSIRVAGDFPQVRPHFDSVEKHILAATLSPTGVRAAFEAHGQILTVPAENGDVRNITRSAGVANRSPAWSPDGQSIAYFSDESGEYRLHVSSQGGLGSVKKIDLGGTASFFFGPAWSPDSTRIAYTDQHYALWYVDLNRPIPVRIDADVYDSPNSALDPSWSPDSQWVAYTKLLRNHMRAVFVYSVATGKSRQVTDGYSDARYAVWDKNGKWLYFTASTNAGPTTGWLDMSSNDHWVTRGVYLTVLKGGEPSPLLPLSDEESPEPPAALRGGPDREPAATDETSEHALGKEKSGKRAPTRTGVIVDFDGIGDRTVSLPVAEKRYVRVIAGKSGEVFLTEELPREASARDNGSPALTVTKFELKTRKTMPFVSGIQSFSLSFDGGKCLFRQGDHWHIAPTAAPVKEGEGRLNLSGMQVWVDPRAEWRQMFHEVWRIERAYFYAPNYHGADLGRLESEYAKFLPGLVSRDDENYLFAQMLANLNTGHIFIEGGALPEPPKVAVGLLGADYTIDRGRYQIAKVYSGEHWNPELRAPLAEPGIQVKAGDYILAVDGRELRASDNLYSYFLDKANKVVVLKVGRNPEGGGARDVKVVPIGDESELRHRDWSDHNLQTVSRLSGGRLAYVYLPNTGNGGFHSFNRYYMAQIDKEGVVIDERFNMGGAIANYMIEIMQRKRFNYWYSGNGDIYWSPVDAILGPKVMITNEMSGSGGDWLPWAFKSSKIGPTIGETTWGGLVGYYGDPPLIDGGRVSAPHVAFFTTDGSWEVENHGVPPDIPVVLDPAAWRQGHDLQLERAIAIALEGLQKNPPSKPHTPEFPDYSEYVR